MEPQNYTLALYCKICEKDLRITSESVLHDGEYFEHESNHGYEIAARYIGGPISEEIDPFDVFDN